jgi:hypothetical protein
MASEKWAENRKLGCNALTTARQGSSHEATTTSDRIIVRTFVTFRALLKGDSAFFRAERHILALSIPPLRLISRQWRLRLVQGTPCL